MASFFREAEHKAKAAWAQHTNFGPEAKALFNNPQMVRIYLDVTETKAKRWFWAGVGGGFLVMGSLWAIREFVGLF